MGLIRKAIFLGTAATGTPLVRWNNSAEAAAKEQRRLMQEQNDSAAAAAAEQRRLMQEQNEFLSELANSTNVDERVHNSYETPAPRVVGRAAPSLTDKLTEIKALLDKGVITADEHAGMRKKILGV